MYYGFNYDVNEHTGVLTLFTNDNKVIAEVSDCNGMTVESLNKLADDVLFEQGYIKENYFSE